MEEIIARTFVKEVADKKIYFNFKTKSRIFDDGSHNIHGYLQTIVIEGRKSFKKSPSSEKLLVLDVEKIDSIVVQLAQESDYENCEGYQHRKVQSYFMSADNRTVAVELPVWSEEMDMSGFADIIRHFPAHGDQPETFQLLDFKPNSKSEKKAATQLHYTKKMLCERALIKPEQVHCIYFDNQAAYKVNT